jgi:xanthine/CO dehydrogenase XdhC/CoxF family maturation factor
LRIGARSPEEVAVSIAAELIEVTRDRVVQSSSSAGAVAALGT